MRLFLIQNVKLFLITGLTVPEEKECIESKTVFSPYLKVWLGSVNRDSLLKPLKI